MAAIIFDAGQKGIEMTCIDLAMRKALFPVLLLAFLTGGVLYSGIRAEDRPPGEDSLLKIDAGRLDAMLDQVALLLEAKTDDAAIFMSEEDVDAELRNAVGRYNVLLALACAKGVLDGRPCGEIYAPPFSSPATSQRMLREEIDAATARIYPFWMAVCAKLDDSAHRTCQME